MRLILHAPNVHNGGGLRLIECLLSMHSLPIFWAQMDLRTQSHKLCPVELTVHWVENNLFARLVAEWRLWRECLPGDVVLCFHSLPPLFPLSGRTVVFLQNRLLIESPNWERYPLSVRARLWLERIWIRMLQRRCSRFIVQTPSMKASLERWLRHEMPISIVPFMPDFLESKKPGQSIAQPSFDFVYVASGEAHKNHRNLIEAWRQLAVAGHRPSLALTLDTNTHPDLCAQIAKPSGSYGLAITNLGALSKQDINTLYQTAGALIYPSKTESFGLPLVEAARWGIPILASELDYVRDVIRPAETFDPNSPTSIARAVKRYLGIAESPIKIASAAMFLNEVMR